MTRVKKGGRGKKRQARFGEHGSGRRWVMSQNRTLEI